MNANTKFLGLGAVLIGIALSWRYDPFSGIVATALLIVSLGLLARNTRR